MTLTVLLIIGIVIFFAGLVYLILSVSGKIAKKWVLQQNTSKTHTIIAACIFAIGAVTIITATGIAITGFSHGMASSNIPITKAIENIQHTPVESKELPEDRRGSIIILYKFNCENCKAIYDDLSETLSNYKNIYWISSESELGKSFAEELEITEVPTGIYMRYNDYNNSVKAVKYSLATTDADGNTILNQTTLDRLIYLQTEKR